MSQIHLPHNHNTDTNNMLEQLPDSSDFQIIPELFKQLSDINRIKIFWLLCHCEECVINISAMMEMSSPAVSHHLKNLKSAGLIVSRREGKEVYYKAADTKQVEIMHNMIESLVDVTCPKTCFVKEHMKENHCKH
ncbi:MAG: winged helix-turn-helix transcriptional regulator [Lachnospiraceae bacterium]|nr:winged helix-turn-helix transcriptional regulator [Lachnospiraceae bacterium]